MELPLFEELVRALVRAGVAVREEPFEQPSKNAGGLCRVQGKALVLLDAGASRPEQQRALLEAVESIGLASLGLRGADLSPELLRALNQRGHMGWPRAVPGPVSPSRRSRRRK